MPASSSSPARSLLLKIPRGILREAEAAFEALIRNWPGQSGVLIRRLYYRCRMKHVGRNVMIMPGVRFYGLSHISLDDACIIDLDCIIFAGPITLGGAERRFIPNKQFELSEGEVKIGKGVHMSVGCYVLGNGGVQIGDYSCCAGGTRILSVSNHYASFTEPSRRDVYFTINAGKEHECYLVGPVVLGRNVGVAANCVLLPGVAICEDSFLRIGSVAYESVIPPNSMAGGDPAVRMRDRFAENTKE